jgi:hypothetical protein
MRRLIRLAVAAAVTGVLVWLPAVPRPASRRPLPIDSGGRHTAAAGHLAAVCRVSGFLPWIFSSMIGSVRVFPANSTE